VLAFRALAKLLAMAVVAVVVGSFLF